MTNRIAACLLFAVGCASTEAQLPSESSTKETRGGDLPSATDTSQSPAADPPLVDWSFEPASADCNGWSVVGADAIRASPARSGSYSCKLCANGSESGLGLTKDLGAVAPGRYSFSAWVRSRVQNPAPGEAHARLEADGADGVQRAATPTVAVRNDWDRLEATIDLEHGASEFRLTIGTDVAETGHCLFVDDVTLTRQH